MIILKDIIGSYNTPEEERLENQEVILLERMNGIITIKLVESGHRPEPKTEGCEDDRA